MTTGTVSKFNMKINSSSYSEKNEYEGLPVMKSHSKFGHQQNTDDFYGEDEYDYSATRSKTINTQSKMSSHKSVLDRYSDDMGGDHMEDKYNQLASRKGHGEMNGYGDLDGYSIHHDPFEQPQPGVKPYSPALRPQEDPKEMVDRQKKKNRHYLGRPPVSDIRKNCRSVLCKSHGDPRWFSY